MIAVLTKYRHVFGMGLQSALVYRWNFILRVAFSLLHLAAVAVLWQAAYANKSSIGGFSFEETMSYFLLLIVANYLISAFNEDFQIGEEIRSGTINQFLTKPIDYYLYRLTLFFASRAVTGVIVFIPLMLLLPLLRDYLPRDVETWRWMAAAPAFALAAIIQFSIAFCFGLLAFWFLEIQGFVILSLAIETLLSGQIFPLDLMPETLYRISQWLPFYYQAYFPVALLTGRIETIEAAQSGLCIQLLWTVAFIGGGRLLWRLGLRRHTAVGG
ncbi:MAG: ABC transporter permease [Opitutaceae bacterium]